MKLSAQDLDAVSGRTLAHYERHAESFWLGTRDHDVAQNIAALKPRGVLFSSNPRGGEEDWNGSRYGACHDLAAWRGYLTRAGYAEREHYYRPAGLPCDQQPWLASVWRRTE